MEITLPQDEFKAQAILADISAKIAAGNAELAQLQQDKELFFAEREEELMQRLQLLLDNSAEFLKIIDFNHDRLEGYAQELTTFASELAKWHEQIVGHQAEFNARKAQFLTNFDDKMTEFDRKMMDVKMQTAAIERTRAEQDKRTLALNARETEINDKYMQLMKTTQRLKK